MCMTKEEAVEELKLIQACEVTTLKQIKALDLAINVLTSHPPDSPFSLIQLKTMSGKVVFVDIRMRSFSYLCDLKPQFGVVKSEESRVHLFNGRSVFFESYGAWLAYPYEYHTGKSRSNREGKKYGIHKPPTQLCSDCGHALEGEAEKCNLCRLRYCCGEVHEHNCRSLGYAYFCE